MLKSEQFRPTFGGHEKFVFRNGWLKKGLDAINNSPLIFTQDEALVTLGVGKNMVRSIRHWCLAANIAEESASKANPKPLVPTDIGAKLLLNEGWDPYLEDTGSLWLLHWQLFSNRTRALIWSIIFSSYLQTEFSKLQLSQLVRKQLEQLNVRATQGSVEREIEVFLRMYVSSFARKDQFIDESLDCPLIELDLIRAIPEEGLYRFNYGPKPSLPAEIFGYSLFQYMAIKLETRRSMAIDEVLFQNGSPGQAFKLSEDSLLEYLVQIENKTGGLVRNSDTAGLRQLFISDEITNQLNAWSYRLLGNYYGQE